MSSAIIQVHDKKFGVYIKAEEIRKNVAALAENIWKDMNSQKPLFLCVLNGSFLFAADLVRNYMGECEISFVKLSSYSGTETTGKVKQLIGLNESIKGRHVVILEDIVDTGITLENLLNQLRDMEPAEIKIATLLLKPEAFKKDIKIDYVGIEIPNRFVLGYGLDYDGLGRNLSDIYQLIE